MPKFILIVDEAPRSHKRTFLVGKLAEDCDPDCPRYEVWEKHAYPSEAAARVTELNRGVPK